MKIHYLGLSILSSACFAESSVTTPPPSPAAIQLELNEAESEFETARKMFNPFYAGPLLAASANNAPPGMINLQPYLFLTTNYARYTSNRKKVDTTNTFQINPSLVFQTGLTSLFDITVVPQGFFNFRDGQNSNNFGDISVKIGYAVHKETAYTPAVRIVIGETLPAGKYEWLNPEKNGIDATGAGNYQFSVALNTQKVIWQIPTHPISVRLSLNYTIPSLAYVEGFNAYGGGYGTNGKVRPGNQFLADFSFEFSITQKWVFACDFVYQYTNATSFSGQKGTTATGDIATIGGPSNDQFSLAPAIEYNFNENSAFLAGAWFTVTGRNSTAFGSAVISYYIYF